MAALFRPKEATYTIHENVTIDTTGKLVKTCKTCVKDK